MKILSFGKLPRLIDALHPTWEEIEYYTHLIMETERRPASALPDCRKEAELQLWADRCVGASSDRKRGRKGSRMG